MKYLKTFENINEPEVGDYVICSSLAFNIPNRYRRIVKNGIGQIINKTNGSFGLEKMYLIKYGKFEEYFPAFNIILFNKDKETLEASIAARKYNL